MTGMPAAPPHSPPLTVSPSQKSWTSLLALPTESLLLAGCDERALVVDGRNSYGFPIVDAQPRARLSSCTSTPPDSWSIEVTDRWRRQLVGELVSHEQPPTVDEVRSRATREIVDTLGLPEACGDRVVLSPSGTDAETLVVALLMYGEGRPVVNVLLGARETGRGTRLAASGRWFCTQTPLAGEVEQGEPMPGFGPDLIRVFDLEVRVVRRRSRRSFHGAP